jgi:hypothetical protein
LVTKRHAQRRCDDTVAEARFSLLKHNRSSVLQAARRRLPDDDPELPFKGGGCNDSI